MLFLKRSKYFLINYMNSINELKQENERIIYRAKQHWGMLLGPLLVLFFALLSIGSKGTHVILLFSVAVIWGIFSYISLQRSEIVLTDKSLFVNVGFPLRRFYDIRLNDIVLIDFYKPSLGAILNFGKISNCLPEKSKKIIQID